MSHYNNHVFICTNKKDNDKKCCANANAVEILAYAKQRAKDLGLNKETKFKVSSSGCMGRCEEGPVLVVYPSGAWYKYNNKEDINNILMSIANKATHHENII
jgi:(2Fe-2S) ferredoxin